MSSHSKNLKRESQLLIYRCHLCHQKMEKILALKGFHRVFLQVLWANWMLSGRRRKKQHEHNLMNSTCPPIVLWIWIHPGCFPTYWCSWYRLVCLCILSVCMHMRGDGFLSFLVRHRNQNLFCTHVIILDLYQTLATLASNSFAPYSRFSIIRVKTYSAEILETWG